MLPEKPVQSDPPNGAGAGAGECTGKKRRKHPGPSLPRGSDEIHISSSSSGTQRDQEESIVITPSDPPVDLEHDIISDEEILGYMEVLSSQAESNAFPFFRRQLDGPRQREVAQRHALYRIRAHKLSKGESRDKLDDATLTKEYPPALLGMERYFKHYEEDDTIDWYFDPCYSKFDDLGDYQRLVLKNHKGVEYLSWKNYHSHFTSYEMDKEYVKCCEEISNKLQCIKRYVKYGRTSPEWVKMSCRGAHHALKIASRFRHMTFDLAHTAYLEHIWSLDFDYWRREDIDRLFFEIWKRVAKKKMAFRDAVEEVHRAKLVPRHSNYTQVAVECSNSSMLKSNYNTCVQGIPDDVAEHVAQELIKRAVLKRPKPKTRNQYIMKKMEIVENIGLDPRA